MKRVLCLWLPWGVDRRRNSAHGGSHAVGSMAASPSRRDQRLAAKPTALAAEPRDHLAGRLALLKLADWCQRFSPTVGVDEIDPAGALFLDVTGIGALFGGEVVLAGQLLRDLIAEHGLQARVAIADTVGAAWALSRFATRRCSTGDPSPLVVPSERTAAALAPLPVAALRLPEQTIALLAELGVRSVGQVASLPRSSLRSRFGSELLLLYDQAMGLANEIIVSVRPPSELQARWLFEFPTNRCDQLKFVMEKLLGKLAALLASERRGALRIEVLLTLEAAPQEHLLIGFFRPSASLRHWLELLDLRLERRQTAALILAVDVAVTATGRLEEIQGALFGENRHAGQRSLATLVERLSSRLGRTAVLRAELLHEAQPEYACRLHPLAGQDDRRMSHATTAARRSDKAMPAAQNRPPQIPGDRPTILFSPPRRLAWRAASSAAARAGRSSQNAGAKNVSACGVGDQFYGGEDVDDGARPGVLGGGADSFQVRLALGPERLETGWWRGRLIRRDYYQVETDTGSRFWLFRELRSGDWFLHGQFE